MFSQNKGHFLVHWKTELQEQEKLILGHEETYFINQKDDFFGHWKT